MVITYFFSCVCNSRNVQLTESQIDRVTDSVTLSPICFRMALNGPVWPLMALYGPYNPMRSFMVLYGPFWPCVALYGPCGPVCPVRPHIVYIALYEPDGLLWPR